MDKFITAKFYRIEARQGASEPFSSKLEILHQTEEDQRCHNIDGVPFWIDNLEHNQDYWTGRFCRKQSSNLPPKATSDTQLVPLGVNAIGQTSAWAYDPELSILVFEANRGGVGLPQFFRYIRTACGCRGYAGLPIVGLEDLAALRDGRLRGLDVKIACPQNLQYVSAEQTAVAQGLSELMGAGIGTQIEVRFSLGVGDEDIKPTRLQRIIQYLRREKEAERGDIKKISAHVLDSEGRPLNLDMLESHMLERQELTLLDDDPDVNYQRIRSFITQCLRKRSAELQELFGEE